MMKDIIKKYKQHKLITNFNIIMLSLLLAVGINFFVIDGTDIGNSLKTSVINSSNIEVKSDLFIEKEKEKLYIVGNKNITDISNLSFSLIYNPENVELSTVNSNIGDVTNLSNTPGISSIILTMDKENIVKKGDKLIEITTVKREIKSENLNIVNANFKDNKDEYYLLTTQGITF